MSMGWDIAVSLPGDGHHLVPSPSSPQHPNVDLLMLSAGWGTAGAAQGDGIPAPIPTPHLGGDTSTVTMRFPPRPSAAAIVCALHNTSFTDGQVLRYIMDNSQRETLLIIQTHTEGRKVHT